MQKVAQKTVSPSKKTSVEAPIVHEIDPVKETKVTVNIPLLVVGVGIVASGVITGYVLASGSGGSGKQITGGGTTAEGLKKVVGVQDEKTFKDSAEGKLVEGGTENGEGTHHLERPGGVSQNVYLTSSTVPLDDYIGKEVKVWGETFASDTAGWFMDVGRLELK